MRNVYIENNPLEESLDNYFSKLNFSLESEFVATEESVGRVLSEGVFAKYSDPTYNASAMDGIAVNSEKTSQATELNPVILELNKDFIYVNTGNPVENYDSIIMIEDVIKINEENVKIISPSYPYQHLRVVGESVAYSEMILPRYEKIRGVDIGAILSSGNDKVKVFKKPKIGIIPTGLELVERVEELTKGKLMESNCKVFKAKTFECGGIGKIYPIVRDDAGILRQSVVKAVEENDIVIVNAGSSAGTKDFSVEVLNELGQVVTHGLAIKPGKPTILSIINAKPVIGIPGYPISGYLVFDLVVKEIIFKMLKQNFKYEETEAFISTNVMSSFKFKEYLRVNLGEVKGKLIAAPLERTASNMLSMIKADGFIEIERNIEGLAKNQKVNVKLYKDLEVTRQKLLICGSHDIIVDVMKNYMPVTSSHTGSMGGIFALLNGSCHIAPIHLLDSVSGEYNKSYIKKYFVNKKTALIKGVKRLQGFMVEKGNPKEIKTFNDLIKVTFANRQNGAGTRILLDYNLESLKIDKAKILGYNKKYTTHLAVAVAVKNQVVDCGLGVYSAAKSLGLDFIPIGYEEYDFLLEHENLSDERIKKFLKILKSPEFLEEVKNLGGYETDGIGEIETYD